MFRHRAAAGKMNHMKNVWTLGLLELPARKCFMTHNMQTAEGEVYSALGGASLHIVAQIMQENKYLLMSQSVNQSPK